jgi:hypothetical protein
MALEDDSPINEGMDQTLSDMDSFKQIIKSIVNDRSSSSARKYPRFPTAQALGDRIGEQGFDGYIISGETGDEVGTIDQRYAEQLYRETVEREQPDDDTVIRGVNTVDFSEDGIQVIFQCDNPLMLANRPLFLVLRRSTIPVLFRWCRSDRNKSRGGFHFLKNIDASSDLATLVAGWSSDLISRLIGNTGEDDQLNKDVFSFAYLNIFYNLRLQFIRELSLLNESIANAEMYGIKTSDIASIRAARNWIYGRNMQQKQASRIVGSQHFRRKLLSFVRPYNQYGCAAVFDNQTHILLEKEFLLALMNCIIWRPCKVPSNHMHTSLKWLYESFHILFEFLPDRIVENEMGTQFKYYNDLLCYITDLRERVIDVLSRAL